MNSNRIDIIIENFNTDANHYETTLSLMEVHHNVFYHSEFTISRTLY